MNDNPVVDVIFGVVVGVFLLVFGCVLGCNAERDYIRKEAVRVGVAEWVANDHGAAQFQWKRTK